MGTGIGGVAVEDLLGNLNGVEGVFAHLHLGLGDEGGRAGSADHLFENAGLAAAFLELGGPKGLPALEKGRFLYQFFHLALSVYILFLRDTRLDFLLQSTP